MSDFCGYLTVASGVAHDDADRAQPRCSHGPHPATRGGLDPRHGRGGLDGRLAGLRRRPVLRSVSRSGPYSRTKLRERSVRRFTAVATCAVVVLACTGLYAAVLNVPNPRALLDTPYGRVLIVKLVLLSSLLGMGASNLLLRGRGPFGRPVVVELLLALGLFVATGILTSLPPASSA